MQISSPNDTWCHLKLPLINLYTVNNPVRLLKSSRVGRNVVGALGVLGRVILVAASLLPEIVLPSIVSAESGVENDVVVLEMVVDDAVASFGGERWSSPSRGIGLAALDVGWNGIGWECPHLDELRRPFHRYDSTSICVE